jgi:hypothetical protein
MNNKDFKQQIFMNNVYDNSNSNLNNVIWNSIETADDVLIKSLNSKLFNTYQAKLNLLYNLLYSNNPLPINNKQSITKFFKIMSPLNNEFNLASFSWNFKFYNDKLYIQNSISKSDFNDFFEMNFLNPIKNILNLSNVNFDFYLFKSNRYYKNLDIVFVFKF